MRSCLSIAALVLAVPVAAQEQAGKPGDVVVVGDRAPDAKAQERQFAISSAG